MNPKLRKTGRATRKAQVQELRKLAVASLPQKNMSEKLSIVGRMMLKSTSWRIVKIFSILVGLQRAAAVAATINRGRLLISDQLEDRTSSVLD